MKRQILFRENRIRLVIVKLAIATILVLSALIQASGQGTGSTAIDIKEISFNPTTIDVTNSSKVITLTIRVTDTERDVGLINVFVRSFQGNGVIFFNMNNLDLISGNGRDGVYRKSAVVPQYSKKGAWEINNITVIDLVPMSRDFRSEELAERGFPIQFQVVNNNEEIPPEIGDFSFMPSVIDTSVGSRVVTINFRALDEPAGVANIRVRFIHEGSCGEDDCAFYDVYITDKNLVSGNNKDGVYRVVNIFPKNAVPGIYFVSVEMSDTLGNLRQLVSSELAVRGFPSQLRVTATIRTTPFDYDGDGRADVSVFRPSDRFWYLIRSTQGFSAIQFGLSSDLLVPADYDGDGKTDIAVYRDGFWFWLNSSNGNFNAVQFGLADDIPAPADFTGDGRAELAVYRGGKWFTLDLTNNQFNAAQFGISTDKPVVGDYDGDGAADLAVFRDGVWYLSQSTLGFYAVHFGLPTDKPVPADYVGDGKTDPAVYRDGNWYGFRSLAGFRFGEASDIPTPADYDGDGRADAAVFRDGNWYLRQSANGFAAVQFGLTTDKPIPAAFLP